MKKYRSLRPGFRHMLILAICLFPFLIGGIWQAVMVAIDDNNYPSVGGYVYTESYDIHYVSKGNGDTAVVFIAGSGTPSAYTDFYKLQETLSEKAQTVSFDHAGSGWSSKTDKPRTVENLEMELRALTDSIAPGKPIILVCHSLGSLEAIYFAQHNADRVKGIVFLDSGDPEFYRADSELSAEILNRGIAFTRTIGLNRVLCSLGIPLPLYGESEKLQYLPSEIAELDKAMFSKYAGSIDTLQSIQKMNENAEQVCSGPRLGKMPILVLSSDSGEDWKVVQNNLARWSENSKQVTLPGSTHYLHWSHWEQVEEEISSFLDSIQ